LPLNLENKLRRVFLSEVGAYGNFRAWAMLGLAQLAPTRLVGANSGLSEFKKLASALFTQTHTASLCKNGPQLWF
jgi:hypothetical protein